MSQCACGCGQTTRLAPENSRAKGWVKGQPLKFMAGHAGRLAALRHGAKSRGRVTPEYRTWLHMRGRCLTISDADYRHYGGRGITVCPEWDDYSVFLAAVGHRPGPGYSLDRFPDNNGNYELGNVRWATQRDQVRNTRHTRRLTHDGETLSLSEWAARLGICHTTLSDRLERGWPTGLALTTPNKNGAH